MPKEVIAAIVLLIAIFAAGTAILIVWRRKHRYSTYEVGSRFETYCAQLLWKDGFQDVELTKASGDFGVDIFATKDGVTWAFQCKCYDKPVGIHAVQEIYSGRDYYRCMVGVVITNNSFTAAATKLAGVHNILLWDGRKLAELAKRR